MSKSPQKPPAEPTPSQTPQQNLTNPFPFPFRYLLRDPPDPISSSKENSLESPLQSPALRSENNDSASKSPERDLTEVFTNCESPMLQMNRSPENPPAASRMAPAASPVAAKIGRGGVNGKELESGVLRRVETRRAELGLRVLGVIFCVISFSVMAADKTTGWAGDSFDRYQEFRYCVSINVIGFVYSVFQVYAQFHYRIKRRRIVDRPLSYYLDFSMDQALAYLLMSASSSAAARNDDWISMFGNDKFTDMMKGSIAMSFLAFFAFALSSIISADKLFSWNL